MLKINEYIYLAITDKINTFPALLLKTFLLALSLVYGLFVRMILFLFDVKYFTKTKLALPSISVGNITWGGTGKTPLVIFLAQALERAGHKPAILTRGYAKKEIDGKIISDEAQVFKAELKSIPVIIGKDRVKSATIARDKYHADCLLLDDAFQRWNIRKDLEIVVINAGNPFGNGCLIPRGILREPLLSLERADVFIINKIDLNPEGAYAIKEKLKRINSNALFVEARYEALDFIDLENKSYAANFLNNKKVFLFSAIADPDYFEKMVKDRGAESAGHIKFRDHHLYKIENVNYILEEACSHDLDFIVTTEKDLVKLKSFSPRFDSYRVKLLVLRIGFKIIDNEKALLEKISNVLNRKVN